MFYLVIKGCFVSGELVTSLVALVREPTDVRYQLQIDTVARQVVGYWKRDGQLHDIVRLSVFSALLPDPGVGGEEYEKSVKGWSPITNVTLDETRCLRSHPAPVAPAAPPPAPSAG